MRRGTDTQTQTRVTDIHFASSTTDAKCNNRFRNYVYEILSVDPYRASEVGNL